MTNVTVRVIAQYFENYSENDTPHWKPKMGQEFVFKADSDWLLYADDELRTIIDKILATESDSHNKYEYRDHQLIFEEPINVQAQFDHLYLTMER